MNKTSLCWKSFGFGLASGAALYGISKYCKNKNFSSNKRVLCIEIGGTSSRFAIYNVDSKNKKISKISPLVKKSINSPEELLEILESKNLNKLLYFLCYFKIIFSEC